MKVSDAKFAASTSYDRSEMKTKIVHLGFGAFHRGHQAVYNDLTNQAHFLKGEEMWGICEVNMFGPSDLIDNLKAQDHLYSVLEQSSDESLSRQVRTITSAIHTPDEGIEKAIAKMAEPQVAIVSLTITEKGYCVNPQTRKLDTANPLIAADLANPSQPTSAIGLIVEACRVRMVNGLPPFSVMSCDNIPENGFLTKQAVLAFAHLCDSQLECWIRDNVTFPNTMVDRICPAMTDESFNALEQSTGYRDPCGLVCESFRQWVIEDNFVASRPDWEAAGALLVGDVLPYEEMKLRLLNGSHSFLAYNGTLLGYDYIYQCMQDSKLRKVAENLMKQEQAVSLSRTVNVDINEYADLLIERFSNTSIKHKTLQIAMDGSQKLPQRAIDPILALLEQGKPVRALPVLIAGWMHFVEMRLSGEETELVDPLADKIAASLQGSTTVEEKFIALLNIEDIFPAQLREIGEWKEILFSAYIRIEQQGIENVIEELSR